MLSNKMGQIKIKENRIQYSTYGKGRPIIFIHGALSNGNTWRKILPTLSQNYLCIVPEFPFGGHKIPIRNEFDFTPNGIANSIASLMNMLNLNETILLANDTGGVFAQFFTAKYPDKVSHLILSNCEGFEIFPPKKFKSIKSLVKLPGYLWLMGELFKSTNFLKKNIAFGLLSHSLKGEELFDLYIKSFTEQRAIRRDFKRMAIEWDPKYTLWAAEELRQFKKPVLILWGKDDVELFPIELGRRINAIFSSSTFIEISNSMTYIQEDQWIEFVEHVGTFLKD